MSLPCATFLLAGTVLATDVPPNPNPVDVGAKTSGIGTDRAPQPAGDPRIDVRPTNVPPGSGPDTPGKTGLGNTDGGPVGGAATGPGTRAETGAPVGAASPAAPAAAP